jgi:hypothetical protein
MEWYGKWRFLDYHFKKEYNVTNLRGFKPRNELETKIKNLFV